MVYPEFPPSFWSFDEAVRLMGLKASMPPTGLATVAAMLPEDKFEVMPIVDLNVEPLTEEVLQSADVVMLSAMIVQKESLRSVIARAKKAGKTVVVGGPYPTSYREEVEAMDADHLVLNEAEQTLAPFVTDFLRSKAHKIYDEHSVLSRSAISLTKEGKPLIEKTPVPRWDLLKLHLYSSLAIQFSRGCPFDCEFCDITALYGHQSRTKTPEQMIAELEAIYVTGWRGSIFIVDDNFIGNKTAVRKFLPILVDWQKKHRFPFSFFTEASVDLANDNMTEVRMRMVEAGFRDIFCGIESTNPEVLARMNKGQNRGDLGNKVRILQRSGLEVTAGFIIGNDDDRPEVFDGLFEFIQENGVVIPMAGLLTALRGTKLYNRLRDEGRLKAESSGNNTHRFKFNFEPKLDEQFLIENYVALLERLFSAKNYYARCWTLWRNRGKHPRVGNINGNWMRATRVVLYRNLIRIPNWHFARFIFGTLFTHPTSMTGAVTQAVKFEHFSRITKAAVSAHRYPEKVETFAEEFKHRLDKLKGDMTRRLEEAQALERRYATKALKYYRSLDPHFREDAWRALVRLRGQLCSHVEAFRKTNNMAV